MAQTTNASHARTGQAQDRLLHTQLEQYFGRRYPESVDSVAVTNASIQIDGTTHGTIHAITDPTTKIHGAGLYLVEVPLFEEIVDRHSFEFAMPLPVEAHHFSVTLSRFRNSSSGRYDRLLSQWALARKTATGYELVSHGHFADRIASRSTLPPETVRCKKGLGGVSSAGPLSDLDQLGICSITMNLPLDFLHGSAARGDIPFSYDGRSYFADAAEISDYDATVRYASQRQIAVAAILLVPRVESFADKSIGRLMDDPDADPAGVYVMPNVTSEAGLRTYAAALDFLAERYSRPDQKYGRIRDWILHNEVDQGWTWTNAGEKSELTYLDLYNRSMRTMYLIARQYDAHARVFISLTHCWNSAADAHAYRPRQMLADLTRFSHAEGDYEWAVAYHPYPESLTNPRTWEDHETNHSLNTPLITFRNVEVLNGWAMRPENMYQGKHRTIFLSEEGFNSPDYSAQSLREQAAGLAYAWKKVEPLAAIEGMQYHNWIDNQAEGGLRIGLRKFREDHADPLGRKPIWYLYQKLGTAEEDKASAFALPVIGIKAWTEILQTPVSNRPARRSN